MAHANRLRHSFLSPGFDRDKINMNNVKIVSPEKTGKDHFALTHEINQPRSRQIDDLHIEQQSRHPAQKY